MTMFQMQMQMMQMMQQQQQQGSGSSGSHELPPRFAPNLPANPSQGEKLEVDIPHLSIAQWALDWKHPKDVKDLRTPCELKVYKKDFTFDLEEFTDWLPRHAGVKKPSSKISTKGNLERFFRMLVIPEGAHWPKMLEVQHLALLPFCGPYVGCPDALLWDALMPYIIWPCVFLPFL